jgi:hypothetical protein
VENNILLQAQNDGGLCMDVLQKLAAFVDCHQ